MREGEAMSYTISTLLIRNLHEVFGENDPSRRRAAIDEIFTEDCVFYESNGVYRGRWNANCQAGNSVRDVHNLVVCLAVFVLAPDNV
jgi:hypothetical protein